MKITLGAKELEKIVGSWATDRYEDGVPSVKIVKRRDSIDVIIDYSNAIGVEILYSEVLYDEDCDIVYDSEYDNEQLNAMNIVSEETQA